MRLNFGAAIRDEDLRRVIKQPSEIVGWDIEKGGQGVISGEKRNGSAGVAGEKKNKTNRRHESIRIVGLGVIPTVTTIDVENNDCEVKAAEEINVGKMMKSKIAEQCNYYNKTEYNNRRARTRSI